AVMPVLLQLFQSSSFALSFSARYRHVALRLRGTGNCGIFTGEYTKGYPGQSQRQSEHHTKIHEPALKPPSSCSHGTAANEGAVAGICGASGVFLFHFLGFAFTEAHFEDSRGSRYVRRGCFVSGDLNMQERPYLNVRQD